MRYINIKRIGREGSSRCVLMRLFRIRLRDEGHICRRREICEIAQRPFASFGGSSRSVETLLAGRFRDNDNRINESSMRRQFFQPVQSRYHATPTCVQRVRSNGPTLCFVVLLDDGTTIRYVTRARILCFSSRNLFSSRDVCSSAVVGFLPRDPCSFACELVRVLLIARMLLTSTLIAINFDRVIGGKLVIRRLCDDARIAMVYARNFRRTGLKVEMPSTGLMLMVIVISC